MGSKTTLLASALARNASSGGKAKPPVFAEGFCLKFPVPRHWVGAVSPRHRVFLVVKIGCGRTAAREWSLDVLRGVILWQEHGGLDLLAVWRKSEPMTIQPPIPLAGVLHDQVAFHRTELGVILGLYGRMVAAGEWRDYGISCLRDVAVFAIFRRTAETPLYRIEKRPSLRMKQGQFALIGAEGQILKRGNDLRQVLAVLERKLFRVID